MSESTSLPTRRSALKAAAGASVLAGVAVRHPVEGVAVAYRLQQHTVIGLWLVDPTLDD